ncbi:MAG: FAD-dependent oxidoreductase [Acidimicrobiia bacterium]|nr:FAD-dependent oxidoreductase [Acidimicrobiia bacterium]
MAAESDVLVIGGGSIGVCTAYYLAKRGLEVQLIDKGDICSGCSYGNACLIVPSHAMPVPAPGVIRKALKWMLKEDSPLLVRPRMDWQMFGWLVRFASFCREEPMKCAIPVLRDLGRASLELFKELGVVEGLSFDFQQRGLLNVYSSHAGFEDGKKEAELLSDFGLEPKVLTGSQARELEPALLKSVVGAVYFPEDAHGSSYGFVTAMGDVIKKRGVTVQTGAEATGWLANGGNLAGVKTTRGDYRAKSIVLAMGAWTPQLARPLGLKIPVQPGKGYSVTMDRPAVCPEIPLIHVERKVAATPIGNRLRFAGTMEFAGIDLQLNPTRTEAILRGAAEVIPAATNPSNVERWCGLRPCTPDGLPIIDRVPGFSSLYVSTGHAMLGYSHGPISGKLLAEIITGSPTSLPVDTLRFGRF